MATAMDYDGYNMNMERSKVRHRKFLAFTIADGLDLDGANSRESITARS